MPFFVLLLQNRDQVLNKICEESLISAVALEKIRKTCGFQFENKMKKSQALKELSSVVSSGFHLQVSPGEQKAEEDGNSENMLWPS